MNFLIFISFDQIKVVQRMFFTIYLLSFTIEP